MSETPDWLTGDIEGQRAEQEQRAVEDAQIYLLFADNERGRELLRRWDKEMLYLRTPVEASLQAYARDEGLRAFVARVHQAIDTANSKRA